MNSKSLQDFFKVMVFASGTPSHFQKEVSQKNPKNVCECAPKTAIAEGYVVKPVLNFLTGSEKNSWPSAILAILENEKKLCKNEVFSPRILANFNNINYIDQFVKIPQINAMIGKEFHIITIHSFKKIAVQNQEVKIDCWIDHMPCDAETSYEKIEALDSEGFGDNLPVIVCQVDMIGEGIDVQSFNAVITASVSDKKLMQQVGRGMRNYYLDGVSKVQAGHCSLYVLIENIEEVGTLLDKLAEYNLTDDCFGWGKRVDISKGSTTKKGEDERPGINKLAEWEEINPNDIDIWEITTKLDKKQNKKSIKEFLDYNFNNCKEDLDEMMVILKKEGLIKKEAKNPQQILHDKIIQAFETMKNNPVLKSVMLNNQELLFNRILISKNFANWFMKHMTSHLVDRFNAVAAH